MKRKILKHRYAAVTYLASFAGGPLMYYGQQLKSWSVYYWMGGVYVLATVLAALIPYLQLPACSTPRQSLSRLIIMVIIPVTNAVVWYLYGGLHELYPIK